MFLLQPEFPGIHHREVHALQKLLDALDVLLGVQVEVHQWLNHDIHLLDLGAVAHEQGCQLLRREFIGCRINIKVIIYSAIHNIYVLS